MAVLTHLLQEAATRQATSVQSDAGLPNLSSGNSALSITVTPIDGQTTFTPARDDTNKAATAPVVDDTSTDVEIDSAQLAVQGEDGAG